MNALRTGGLLAFLSTALVGWNLAAPRVETVVKEVPPTKHSERKGRPSRISAASGHARQRMAAIRAAGSPAARMRATVALANSLAPAEFAAWINGGWFNLRDGPEFMVFRDLMMARWKTEDSDGMAAFFLSRPYSRENDEIISAWAKEDPQRMIAYFKSHPDELKEARLLAALAEANPALVLARVRELKLGGISPGSVDSFNATLMFRQLAGKIPLELEAALESLPDHLRSQAEGALSGERLKLSFETEIHALWNRPDGLNLFRQNLEANPGLAAKLFGELANLPPAWRESVASNTGYFLSGTNYNQWWAADLAGAGFSAAQIKSIRQRVVVAMITKEPEEAIRRIAGLGIDPGEKQYLIARAFEAMADSPDKAGQSLALLENDAEREIARKAMVHSPDDVQGKPIVEPSDLLEKMGATGESRMEEYVSELGKWDEGKRAGFITEFKALPDDKKRVIATAVVKGSEYFNGNTALTEEALRFVAGHPGGVSGQLPGSYEAPLESNISRYAVRLMKKDPVAAGAFVESLPPGDAKLWARRNLIDNWKQYDPKAAAAWEKSLSEADRAALEKIGK